MNHNETSTQDAANAPSPCQLNKQDEGIQFRMRMICKNTKLLPCYKVSKVWMVPITMLQQVYFPKRKLTSLERKVRECTGTKLKLMEKTEIDQMRLWLHKTKANKNDSFPALTPSEYSCSVEDLRDNFEYLEQVVLRGGARSRCDMRDYSRRELYHSRTKNREPQRQPYIYSPENHKDNSTLLETSTKKSSLEVKSTSETKSSISKTKQSHDKSKVKQLDKLVPVKQESESSRNVSIQSTESNKRRKVLVKEVNKLNGRKVKNSFSKVIAKSIPTPQSNSEEHVHSDRESSTSNTSKVSDANVPTKSTSQSKAQQPNESESSSESFNALKTSLAASVSPPCINIDATNTKNDQSVEKVSSNFNADITKMIPQSKRDKSENDNKTSSKHLNKLVKISEELVGENFLTPSKSVVGSNMNVPVQHIPVIASTKENIENLSSSSRNAKLDIASQVENRDEACDKEALPRSFSKNGKSQSTATKKAEVFVTTSEVGFAEKQASELEDCGSMSKDADKSSTNILPVSTSTRTEISNHLKEKPEIASVKQQCSTPAVGANLRKNPASSSSTKKIKIFNHEIAESELAPVGERASPVASSDKIRESAVDCLVNANAKSTNQISARSNNSSTNALSKLVEQVKAEPNNSSESCNNVKVMRENNLDLKSSQPIPVIGQPAYQPFNYMQVPLSVFPMNLANAITMPSCIYLPITESNANASPSSKPLNGDSKENSAKLAKEKNRNLNNNNTASCFSHVLDELQENHFSSKSDSNAASKAKKKVKKDKKLKISDKKIVKPVKVKSKILSLRKTESSTNLSKSKDQKRIRHIRSPLRTVRQVEYSKKLLEAVHRSLQKGKESMGDFNSNAHFSSARYEVELKDKQRRSFDKDNGSSFERDSHDSRRYYSGSDRRSISSAEYFSEEPENSPHYQEQDNRSPPKKFSKPSEETLNEAYACNDEYHAHATDEPFEHQQIDYWDNSKHAQNYFPSDTDRTLAAVQSIQELRKHLKKWKRENSNQNNTNSQKRFHSIFAGGYKEPQKKKKYWSKENNAVHNAPSESFIPSAGKPFYSKGFISKTIINSRFSGKPCSANTRGKFNNYYRSKSVQKAKSILYKPNRYHYYGQKFLADKNQADQSNGDVHLAVSENTVPQKPEASNPVPKLAGHKELVRRIKTNVPQMASKNLPSNSETALSDLISFIRNKNLDLPEQIDDPSGEMFHHYDLDSGFSVKVSTSNTLLPPNLEPKLPEYSTKSKTGMFSIKKEKNVSSFEGTHKVELSPSCLSEFVTLDEDWEDNDNRCSRDSLVNNAKSASGHIGNDNRDSAGMNFANKNFQTLLKKTKGKERVSRNSNFPISVKKTNESTQSKPLKTTDTLIHKKKKFSKPTKMSFNNEVAKLLEKVEEEDLIQAEKSVELFLRRSKKELQNHSVKWPFNKRDSGWNDVFLNFSLNIDLKINDLIVAKDASDNTVQDRSKVAQPRQWKKKLIEQIDMDAFSKQLVNRDSIKLQDIESLKSDVSTTVSEILNVVEHKMLDAVNKKDSTLMPFEKRADLAQSNEQSLFKTALPSTQKIMPSSANIFERIAVETSCGDDEEPLGSSGNSDYLRKLDFFQAISQKSSQYFDMPKHQYAISAHACAIQSELMPNNNRFGKDKPTDEDSTVNKDSISEDEEELETDIGSDDDSVPESHSQCFEQLALKNRLSTVEKEFSVVYEKKLEVDDDASTFVPDEHEQSSDETLSDSDKIPLRFYAKVPLWNNKELLKAWDVKKCVVNVKKLPSSPALEDYMLNATAFSNQSLNANNSDRNSNVIVVSAGNSKISKAKKSIYRPSRSLLLKNDQNLKNEEIEQNNETHFNVATTTIASDQLVSTKGVGIPKESVNEKSKFIAKSAVKQQSASSSTAARSIAHRLLKRRTELPSVSSDEEEIPLPAQERASPVVKSSVDPPDGCSDDDVLLISCKPYLSKSNKEKESGNIQHIEAKPSVRSIKVSQGLNQRSRNKARKRATSKVQNRIFTTFDVSEQQLSTTSQESQQPNTTSDPTSKVQKNQDQINVSQNITLKSTKDDGNSISVSLQMAPETNLNTFTSNASTLSAVSPTRGESNSIQTKDDDGQNLNKNSTVPIINQNNTQLVTDLLPITSKAKSAVQIVNDSRVYSKGHNQQSDQSKSVEESTAISIHPQTQLAEDVYSIETINAAPKLSISLPVFSKGCYDLKEKGAIVDSENKPYSVKENENKVKIISHSNAMSVIDQATMVHLTATQNKSIAVVVPTDNNTSTNGVFEFKTASTSNQPELRNTLTSNKMQAQKNLFPYTSLSAVLSSGNERVLSPAANSVFGETYHHGMLEINLSAPAACLQLGRRFHGKILPYGVMAFIRRRIPYIQVRLNQNTSKISDSPSIQSSAVSDAKAVANCGAKSPNILKNDTESGTLLIRMRDAAFSLKIDSKSMLQQVKDFQIRCYIPNEYTESVYEMVYNKVALADETMKILLGLHHPTSKAALNENSMMHLNDYLKIILPVIFVQRKGRTSSISNSFYVQRFRIFKDDLPNYVSVTTYKPIDIVTPLVVQTFSQSYAYNRTLIDGDISIKTLKRIAVSSSINSNSRNRAVNKRKSSTDSNSSQKKVPKLVTALKTKSNDNEQSRAVVDYKPPNGSVVATNSPHALFVQKIKEDLLRQNMTFPQKGGDNKCAHNQALAASTSPFTLTSGAITSLIHSNEVQDSNLNVVLEGAVTDKVNASTDKVMKDQPNEVSNRNLKAPVTSLTSATVPASADSNTATIIFNSQLSISQGDLNKTIGAKFVNDDRITTTSPLAIVSAQPRFSKSTIQKNASSFSESTSNVAHQSNITVPQHTIANFLSQLEKLNVNQSALSPNALGSNEIVHWHPADLNVGEPPIEIVKQPPMYSNVVGFGQANDKIAL